MPEPDSLPNRVSGTSDPATPKHLGVLLDAKDYSLTAEEYERKTGQQRPEVIARNPVQVLRGIDGWIILYAEKVNAARHKAFMSLLYIMLSLALISFAYVFILRSTPWIPQKERRTKSYYCWFTDPLANSANVGAGAICLIMAVPVLVRMIIHCIEAARLKASGEYVWSRKRKRISLFALWRQLAQTINLIFWVLQNAYVLGKECSWFDLFPIYCGLVQWSCFNVVFVLDITFIHCLSPWTDKQGNLQRHLPGNKDTKFAPDPVLLDEPMRWRRHWNKLALWLVFQCNILWFAIYVGIEKGLSSQYVNVQNRALQNQPNCVHQPYDCTRHAAYIVFASIIIAMVVMHAVLCFYYTEHAFNKLRVAGPYCLWERPYKMLRFAQAMSGWISTMGIVATAGLMCGFSTCSELIMSFFGIMPLQVTSTAVASAFAYLYTPAVPHPEDVVVQAWLREMAWSPGEVGPIRDSLTSRMPSLEKQFEKEPIFCFEYAAKLLLWSDLVYSEIERKPGSGSVKGEDSSFNFCAWNPCCPFTSKSGVLSPAASLDLPSATASEHDNVRPEDRIRASRAGSLASTLASIGEDRASIDGYQAPTQQARPRLNRGVKSFRLADDGMLHHENGGDVSIQIEQATAGKAELGLALKLFHLTDFEVLHEPALQTKVLLGWSSSCAVLAFRGTASAVNAWNDLKVFRLPHPPARGNFWLQTRPMVHGGFLRSWVANELNQRVMGRLREILKASVVPPADFKVLLTGHSLGGALATLAGIEIGRDLGLTDISCYTYGAPRTGNHAFAKDYNRYVPDTWHIINDRDAVPRIGKIGVFYKRPGYRVLLNRQGDIRVRPDIHQIWLHTEGFSVKEHMLDAYRATFAAFMSCQLVPERCMDGGKAAIQRFAADGRFVALANYLGLDLRMLLKTPADEINIGPKPAVAAGLNPFSVGGFINNFSKLLCKGLSFIFGAALVAAAKNVFHTAAARQELEELQEQERD